MVGHDHEVMQPEFPRCDIGTQHVDHQCGIAFRLQQRAPLAGLCGGEKRTRRTHNPVRAGVACRSCHHQGLKPDSFPYRCGTAKAMP